MSPPLQTISSNLTKQSKRDRTKSLITINFPQKIFFPRFNIHIYIYIEAASDEYDRPTSRKQQAALKRSFEWKLKQLETVRFPFDRCILCTAWTNQLDSTRCDWPFPWRNRSLYTAISLFFTSEISRIDSIYFEIRSRYIPIYTPTWNITSNVYKFSIHSSPYPYFPLKLYLGISIRREAKKLEE